MKDQHVQSSQESSQVKSSQKGEGGVEGCEGADGVEQRAASAAHEAEGDDGDEAMEGVENQLQISLLRTSRCSHGCSMPRGAGARPAASRRRSRREGQMSRSPRSSDKMVNDRAGHARHEGPVLPSWDVNEEPKYRTQLRAGFLTTSKDHELFDRGDYDPLFLSPNPPSLSLLDAGRSRADFLFVVRVALIGRDRPASTYLGAAK